MKITVTQEDIDTGLRHSCFACPIALAVIRAAGRRNFMVGLHKVLEIDRPGQPDREFPLPANATYFINRFDEGNYVKPFEFELEGL